MRRPAIASLALGGVLALALLAWQSETSAIITLPNALVVSDLGDPSGAVASMEARGWTVTASNISEVATASEETLSAYDVAWIPAAGASHAELYLLVQPGESLWRFTEVGGGILVVMGLAPDTLWPDMAPEGTDAEAKPERWGQPAVFPSPVPATTPPGAAWRRNSFKEAELVASTPSMSSPRLVYPPRAPRGRLTDYRLIRHQPETRPVSPIRE